MKRPGEQRLETATSTLNTSLVELYAAIDQRIREEQLTNQLTRLPNLPALEEWLDERIEQASNCWVALVEIDGFKGINQQFGYENADGLLKEVARTLRDMTTEEVTAYHAHGDEFYLAGPLTTSTESALSQVEGRLTQARETIASLRIASDKKTMMKCTVSIGWTTLEDAQTTEAGATAKYLARLAEDANKLAKSAGRNCVKRWDKNILLPPMVDPRVNCDACGAVISIMVTSAKWEWGGAPMTCPNCGKKMARPFVERRDPQTKAALTKAFERRGAKRTTPKKPAPKKPPAKKPTKRKK